VTTCPLNTMAPLSEDQVGRKPLVVILGPTAVGKSSLAIALAKQLDAEILTADSRQVYCGMDVGTDKPPAAARQGVTHHLIDLIDPDEPFNAGLFRQHAIRVIEEVYRRRRLPLVVGGTGLYIRILLQGLCAAPPSDPTVRAQLCEEARDEGHNHLYARLAAADPATAAKLHPRDTSKIIRALEVHRLSGVPLSSYQAGHGFMERPFSTLVIGLNRDRQSLYRRIEERIDWQLANGLVEETRRLLDSGYRRDSPAMTGLGYRHIAAYLAGTADRNEMISQFKRDTRRFAKRQMTWFRREPDTTWLMTDESEPLEDIAARARRLIDPFLSSLDRGGETRGEAARKGNRDGQAGP
jgi:tRNA dimethylallyltransferase